MSIFVMVVSILFATAQSFFGKLFTNCYPGDKKVCSTVYTVWYCLVSFFANLALNGFSFSVSRTTVLLSVANAAILFFYNMMLLRASASGPYSMTMIFNLVGSLAVPVFVTMLAGSYTFSWVQFVAFALVIVSFVLLNLDGLGEKAKSKLFYLYGALLFLCNGFYGVLMDVQQSLMHQTERAEYMMLSFGISALLAFVVLLFQRRKQTFRDLCLSPKSAGCMFGGSLSCTAASNLIMICMALFAGGGAIVLPVVSAGVLVCSILASVLLLKEKFPPVKIVGTVLALIGIVLLSI